MDGSSFLLGATVLATVSFVWFISMDLVDLFKWVADVGKNPRWFSILDHNRFKIGGGIAVVLTLLMAWNGVIDLLGVLTFNVSLSSALHSGMILVASFKLYVIFTLAGVYSHLFADMTTKAGISIFFKPLAPAKVILKVKKIPVVGKLLVPTEFTTGSKWEDYNRRFITIVCIPAFLLAVGSIIGFDLTGLWGTDVTAHK